MFDFLRNITKPAQEKRQERLNAYLDGALSTQERRRFETELEQDAELRADLEQLRWVKLSVEQLPRVRAPRNFILDPAVYGQPVQQKATWTLYPGLRVATALTAFFFILALALDVATPGGTLGQPLLGGAAQTAMEEPQSQAGDVAMVAEPEMASEAAEEPAEEDGALVAPFATTVEGEVGAAAEEAAEEIVEEEALLAEEAAEEPAAEEPAADTASADQPDTEETIGPAAGAAEETTERTIEATIASDEAAEITALAPPETPAPESTGETANALEEPLLTDDAQGDADAFAETEAERQQEMPFPYLLAIEIVLGVALLVLLISTVVMRRIA